MAIIVSSLCYNGTEKGGAKSNDEQGGKKVSHSVPSSLTSLPLLLPSSSAFPASLTTCNGSSWYWEGGLAEDSEHNTEAIPSSGGRFNFGDSSIVSVAPKLDPKGNAICGCGKRLCCERVPKGSGGSGREGTAEGVCFLERFTLMCELSLTSSGCSITRALLAV